ncbi:MAG: hypothetical protein RCG15_03565 [Candidatus Rickettsia vulgarisii]
MVRFGVPNFTPIDQEIIQKHLDTNSPIWQEQFKAFQESFSKQANQGSLGAEAKEKLQELQKTITQCFKDHPLSSEIIDKFLQDPDITRFVTDGS